MSITEDKSESHGLELSCCLVNRLSSGNDMLDAQRASELEDIFKVLANDTRLRLLHNLARVEEICVCDLARLMGMRPQAVSNQLQRLSDRGIVSARRSGNMIYYRVIDTCIIELLDRALCLSSDSKRSKEDSI